MTKPIERVFRDRPLTEDEAARDAEIRRKVQAEFPPASGNCAPGVLSQSLRDAIRASGRSIEQIASAAEMSPVLLSRFLAGERDIHMAIADKLAAALGLKLAAAS